MQERSVTLGLLILALGALVVAAYAIRHRLNT
jgi:hypothetical protein